MNKSLEENNLNTIFKNNFTLLYTYLFYEQPDFYHKFWKKVYYPYPALSRIYLLQFREGRITFIYQKLKNDFFKKIAIKFIPFLGAWALATRLLKWKNVYKIIMSIYIIFLKAKQTMVPVNSLVVRKALDFW